MNFLRSIAHVVWMAITVIPWALFVVVVSYFISSTRLYWICAAWLRLAVNSGTWILGIENRIQGMENLPQGSKDPAVLLVKHQSTWETFVMPAIMPHPLAYVFKKELLSVPFFGWAMGRLDMIHIDRKQRSRAFAKVVQQGRRLAGRHEPSLASFPKPPHRAARVFANAVVRSPPRRPALCLPWLLGAGIAENGL